MLDWLHDSAHASIALGWAFACGCLAGAALSSARRAKRSLERLERRIREARKDQRREGS